MSPRYCRLLCLIVPNLANADKGKVAWQGADKPDDLKQKVKRDLGLGMMLIPVSFATSATLMGCGSVASSTNPSDSAITSFGYTGSPLAATLVPVNKSTPVSDAYFGMTIHRLVSNPSSSKAAVPFPAFSIHTFRFWDVVTGGRWNLRMASTIGPRWMGRSPVPSKMA